MDMEGSESVNRLKVFVGNLAFFATETDISELFSQYGEVIGVNLRTDRATGKKKGFGFVTFSKSSSAQAAIAAANGAMFQGRTLTVNAASEFTAERSFSITTAMALYKDFEAENMHLSVGPITSPYLCSILSISQ